MITTSTYEAVTLPYATARMLTGSMSYQTEYASIDLLNKSAAFFDLH